jgi:glycosyltransferase involved in cell wall biosynthesis
MPAAGDAGDDFRGNARRVHSLQPAAVVLMTIPVTAIVVTKNEERRIRDCLNALQGFQDILVVDSGSRDKTVEVATRCGARVVDFIWDGTYPKKRQWVLDHVPLRTDWIFFVDADEIVTDDLKKEISELFKSHPPCDGYFVKGRYRIDGRLLRFGVQNNKLALLNRHKFVFPVVDDLDIPGMGEIEGHYQPVRKADGKIGYMRHTLIHTAYEDERSWIFRHEKYARWESGMNRRNSWPADPVPWRQKVKLWLRGSQWRPEIMFLVNYICAGGILDGRAGYKFARSRYRYYKLIQSLDKS